MEKHLWTLLGQTINADQRSRLEKLLIITDDGGRQFWFDKLRKGPVRITAPALVKALERIETSARTGHHIADNIQYSAMPSGFAGTACRYGKVTALQRPIGSEATI